MSHEPIVPRVLLEVVAGPHVGRRIEFDGHDTLLVGRGSLAALRLANDPYVSRYHCLLEINPPDVLVRDLGSRSGTAVNGNKVGTHRLRPGDVISVGATRVRFALADAGDAVETADLPLPSGAPAPGPAGAPASTRLLSPPPLATTTSEPLPPVPGYEIQRVLGRGGMGMVYLARHEATGAPVAIKVVVPEMAASDRAVQRFLREARVLSELDHPRVVRFREMGLHLGQLYFVMEYVETVDRKAITAAPTPVRVRAACAVLCQVLEGLQYAHDRGFVHRDIKPDNVLLTRGPGGAAWAAKLADFGLAKNFESAGLSGMTHEGQALGTIPFMAPEQVVSAREARPAVDVYSAGAALYFLLCGQYPLPFGRGRDPLAVILDEAPIPLGDRLPDAPPGLGASIARSLEKSPAERPPSAEAFRRLLLPFAEQGKT